MGKRLLGAALDSLMDVQTARYRAQDKAAATRCKTVADGIPFEIEYIDDRLHCCHDRGRRPLRPIISDPEAPQKQRRPPEREVSSGLLLMVGTESLRILALDHFFRNHKLLSHGFWGLGDDPNLSGQEKTAGEVAKKPAAFCTFGGAPV